MIVPVSTDLLEGTFDVSGFYVAAIRAAWDRSFYEFLFRESWDDPSGMQALELGATVRRWDRLETREVTYEEETVDFGG